MKFQEFNAPYIYPPSNLVDGIFNIVAVTVWTIVLLTLHRTMLKSELFDGRSYMHYILQNETILT